MKAWHPSTQSSSRLLVTVSDAQIDGLLILRWCFMSGMGPGDVQYYSSTRILSMLRFSTCCISICNWVFTVLRMFLSSFIEFYTILMCLWLTLLNVSYKLDVVCCFMVVFCSPFGIFHSSFFVFLYGAHF